MGDVDSENIEKTEDSEESGESGGDGEENHDDNGEEVEEEVDAEEGEVDGGDGEEVEVEEEEVEDGEGGEEEVQDGDEEQEGGEESEGTEEGEELVGTEEGEGEEEVDEEDGEEEEEEAEEVEDDKYSRHVDKIIKIQSVARSYLSFLWVKKNYKEMKLEMLSLKFDRYEVEILEEILKVHEEKYKQMSEFLNEAKKESLEEYKKGDEDYDKKRAEINEMLAPYVTTSSQRYKIAKQRLEVLKSSRKFSKKNKKIEVKSEKMNKIVDKITKKNDKLSLKETKCKAKVTKDEGKIEQINNAVESETKLKGLCKSNLSSLAFRFEQRYMELMDKINNPQDHEEEANAPIFFGADMGHLEAQNIELQKTLAESENIANQHANELDDITTDMKEWEKKSQKEMKKKVKYLSMPSVSADEIQYVEESVHDFTETTDHPVEETPTPVDNSKQKTKKGDSTAEEGENGKHDDKEEKKDDGGGDEHNHEKNMKGRRISVASKALTDEEEMELMLACLGKIASVLGKDFSPAASCNSNAADAIKNQLLSSAWVRNNTTAINPKDHAIF